MTRENSGTSMSSSARSWDTLANVAAWREQQEALHHQHQHQHQQQQQKSSSRTGHHSSEDDVYLGTAAGQFGGEETSEDRMDDAASSEGQGTKRGSESQGDHKDEPRRKRLVTTPHREFVSASGFCLLSGESVDVQQINPTKLTDNIFYSSLD